MSKKYQVLARRYRPQRFSEVVGQAPTVTTLQNAIRFEKVAGAYLFCGGRGVGKTTLARLFAKALNCQSLSTSLEPCGTCSSCTDITAGQSLDVIEIDGASNRGIDDVRQINETVGYAPSYGKYKIYIIDEVHMLTKEAFNALLKTLEEPPATAKFFFATTEAHKVLPTIISRCQRFDLARISPTLITSKLAQIATDLARETEPAALELIASFAEGSLRDAESLFDQILCFAEGTITTAVVRQTLGLVPQELFFSLDQAFAAYDLGYAFALVENLFQTGKDLSHFLEQLVEHYRTLTLIRTLNSAASESLLASARLYTKAQLLHILDLLIQSESSFAKSPFPRITLESTLLQIIRSKHRIPVETIVRKLTEAPTQETPAAEIPPSPKPESIPVIEAPKPEPIKPILQEAPKPAPVIETPKPEPVKAPILQAVPFNPLAAAPKPTEPVETPKPAPQVTPSKHPSHYETILRFASVELEGTVKN